MGLPDIEMLLHSPEARTTQVFEMVMDNEEQSVEVCDLGESIRD